MRKFIIQHWFGIFRLKNGYEIDKAAVANFTLLIPGVLFHAFTENLTLSGSILLAIFGIIYFTTFFYFQKWPVHWDELPSDLQKWYYGKYWVEFVGNKMPWPQSFTDNLDEWKKLNKKFKIS